MNRPKIPSHQNAIDLVNTRIGQLLLVRYQRLSHGIRRRHQWWCRCDCGVDIVVFEYDLLSGNAQSCGCLRRQRYAAAKTTHGYTTRNAPYMAEYRSWAGMRERCYCETIACFRHYGGRGISMSDPWRFGDGNRVGFQVFLDDMGLKPTPLHSLDRIDNNGNYEAGNCRWASQIEQARNKRNNVLIDVAGQTMTLSEALTEVAYTHQHYYDILSDGVLPQEAFEIMQVTPRRGYDE